MGRITTHDIRRGAAAEITRMPLETTQNIAVSASVMGHLTRTLLTETTQDYIGDTDIDFWERGRKESGHHFRRDRLVSSEPFEKPVVTNQQIREFKERYPEFEGTECTIRHRILWMAKRE